MNKRSKLAVAKVTNPIELGRGKKISIAARSAVLQDLKAQGCIVVDVGISPSALGAARKELAQRKTDYGPLLIPRRFTTHEGEVTLPVQNPIAMLSIAMAESERYAQYMRKRIATRGAPSVASPWTIIIYVDEVTCGNPLATKASARRQIQGVYWSIYQLGPVALADETCWFELVAFRTLETQAFVGSVSHLLDVCLSCFFDPIGIDVRYGVRMRLTGYGDLMLCLKVEMLIADIKAIVQAIGANGVSALLPCFFCRRVLSFAAKAQPRFAAVDELVDLGCLDQDRWCKHTNESLKQLLVDLRHTATTQPQELKAKQTLSGYKHVNGNFLSNSFTNLLPINLICLDWMHLFFQSGNWNREVFQILKHASASARNFNAYELMHAYIDKFAFPAGRGIGNLLSSEHWASCKEAKLFKCQASDGLNLYSVMHRFFVAVLLPAIGGSPQHDTVKLQVDSYGQLCDVVDLLQLSKFGKPVPRALFREKVVDWGTVHQNAYGVELWYLKSHLTLHLPDVLDARGEDEEDAMSLACWVLEMCLQSRKVCTTLLSCICALQVAFMHDNNVGAMRRMYPHSERHHAVIRKHAALREHTSNMEKGLAEDVAIESLRNLREQPAGDGLLRPSPASQALVRALDGVGLHGRDVHTSVTARSGPITIHRGDIVIYKVGAEFCAGDVIAFAASSDWSACAVISAWEQTGEEPGVRIYRIVDGVILISCSAIVSTAVAHIGQTTANVLCPPLLNYNL